jgi:site-specific recombinase XerC
VVEQRLFSLFNEGGPRVRLVFRRYRRAPALASDVLGVPLGSRARQQGRRYPADLPRVEEIVAVMRVAGEGVAGDRVRGLIVVLWRAGLWIQEALDLYERDLEPRRGALLVRSGKGGRRREVGMDDLGWEHLSAWALRRLELPADPLFCSIDGPTRGRPWPQTGARSQLRRLAAEAGVRRRFAPHQLRHAHAVEMAREEFR